MLFCLCPQHPAREYDGPCQGDLIAGVRIPLGISIREYRCEKHGNGLLILRGVGGDNVLFSFGTTKYSFSFLQYWFRRQETDLLLCECCPFTDFQRCQD
jgi:hypothetical protein